MFSVFAGGKRRHFTRLGAIIAVLAIASTVSFFALNARGSALSLTVDSAGAAAADAVPLTGSTFAAAQAAITAKAPSGHMTFPFSFQGAHAFNVSSAQIDYDAADHAIAFTGDATLPAFNGGEIPGANQSFSFLITAQWPDASSTTPKLAFVLKSSSVPLSSLNSLWGSAYGGISFSDVRLAIANGSTTPDPAHLPSIADSFFGDDKEPLDVTAGVAFHGALDVSGRIADAFGYAGWGGPIALDGTLSSSNDMFFGSADDAGLGALDLKVQLGKASSAPAWLTDRSTTFEFSLDSSHVAKLEAHDDVHVGIDGTTNEFQGDVSIASSGAIHGHLGNIGALDAPYGLSNVSLANVAIDVDYDTTSHELAGKLKFDATVNTHTFTVDAGIKVAGSSVSADLSIEGAVTVQDVATFASKVAGATPVTIPAADTFSLDSIKFSLDRSPDEIIVSLGASATVRSLTANAVFTLRKKVGESAKPLLGLKLSDPNCDPGLICLSDVLPAGSLGDLAKSLKVPALDLVVTPTSFTSLPKDELTGPEQDFFASVYDTIPDTITFGGGLSLHTKFPVSALPQSVTDTFGWTPTDFIELNGSLGGSSDLGGVDDSSVNLTGMSLHATFPASSGASFLPSWVSFTSPTVLGFAYAGGNVQATFSTGAHIALGSGFDVTIDAGFTKTSAGSSIDFAATIASWDHPFGVQWLNVTNAALKVKAEFGTSTKVSASLGGDITVGGQPFSLLVSLNTGDATKATVKASYNGST